MSAGGVLKDRKNVMKKALAFAVALGVVLSGFVAATPAMASGAPDYVIDCQAAQTAPWVDTDPSASYQGSQDVYLGGDQQYTKTVEIKNCGYHLAKDGVIDNGAYVGTSADVTYTIVIPVDTFKEARGYNTTYDLPLNTTFIINFWNFAPSKSVTSDVSSISEGQSATFSTANVASDALYGLFVDGTLSQKGPLYALENTIAWSAFGDCSSHVVELRVYDATYTGSETVTHSYNYAAGAAVTFNAGTTGACTPPPISISADKEAIGEGEGVTFTPTGGNASSLTAIFIDGVLAMTGPLTGLGNAPLPWEIFGNCTSHVATVRIYNSDFTGEEAVSFSDAYAASVDVTLNAGTTGACATAPTPKSISVDKSSIHEGQAVTFTPTASDPQTLYGLFKDGAFLEAGPVSAINSALPWSALGDCQSHVVTLRLYDSTFSGSSTVTWQDTYATSVNVTFAAGTTGDCAAAVTPTVKYKKATSTKTFKGFAVNSAKLTKTMKAGIKAFIRAHSGITTIDITGFTMGPVSKADSKLALNRAKAVKTYVKSLISSAKIVIHAKRDKKLGAKYRRATIVLNFQTAS